MTEAYDAIRENFPFLSQEEAQHLLGAFRGWVKPSDVSRMLKDYRSHALFVRVLGDAFPWLETGNVRKMANPSIARRIRSALKQFVLKE